MGCIVDLIHLPRMGSDLNAVTSAAIPDSGPISVTTSSSQEETILSELDQDLVPEPTNDGLSRTKGRYGLPTVIRPIRSLTVTVEELTLIGPMVIPDLGSPISTGASHSVRGHETPALSLILSV